MYRSLKLEECYNQKFSFVTFATPSVAGTTLFHVRLVSCVAQLVTLSVIATKLAQSPIYRSQVRQ